MRIEVTELQIVRGRRQIVHDFDLTVPEGKIVGLVGPNGCGKSTLLRAIAGIGGYAAGSVRLGGSELHTLTRREVARRVAVMTQHHDAGFELPVLDLVLLGRLPHGRGFGADGPGDLAAATDALAATGASTLAERCFGALSGGEQQRVLLARALAQETPALILDEPTNHLDIAHQLELLDLIAHSGRSVLIALHDLNLAARFCDTVAVLDDGRLVADGAPSQVFGAELIRTVFGVDSTEVSHPHTGLGHHLFDRVHPGHPQRTGRRSGH